MKQENCVLGIELGSTTIKAVLIDEGHKPVATGSFAWENELKNGIWTYSMDKVFDGLRACYRELASDFEKNHGQPLTNPGVIGVSGMMHGYLPFDKDGKQICEFRTWRNTITGEAAGRLSELFSFNVPQRWSIAHFYQAMLNKEDHVKDVAFVTTLAGYVHYLLTGRKITGIGEASGMFPIDSEKMDYTDGMVDKFKELTGVDIREVFPKVLVAGDDAGELTEEGAKFLDPSGNLKPGIPFVPCEGDAGTGMVATNSVRVNTGNVSAGTSDFAMLVADHQLGVHEEVDMVTTPAGNPVAMVHCANCTSDINAWVGLFAEFAKAFKIDIDKGELFTKLFALAALGNPDCGGMLSYNYYSGEHLMHVEEGRPVFIRRPDSEFNLANFMRTHLMSALATLKLGLDILIEQENVKIDKIYGHGGFFKTPIVGQMFLSAAIGAPVSVMETAGEGGPYGMALLGAYRKYREEGESLADYLDNKVFADAKVSEIMATEDEIKGFDEFAKKYKAAFEVEKAAIKHV